MAWPACPWSGFFIVFTTLPMLSRIRHQIVS
jgi:hypothetical protein